MPIKPYLLMSNLPGLLILTNGAYLNVTSNLAAQLQITETITFSEFEERIAADPNYIWLIHSRSLRVLVIATSLYDMEKADHHFDVVMYIQQGEAYIQRCLKPCARFSLPVQRLTIYNLMYGPPNSCGRIDGAQSINCGEHPTFGNPKPPEHLCPNFPMGLGALELWGVEALERPRGDGCDGRRFGESVYGGPIDNRSGYCSPCEPNYGKPFPMTPLQPNYPVEPPCGQREPCEQSSTLPSNIYHQTMPKNNDGYYSENGNRYGHDHSFLPPVLPPPLPITACPTCPTCAPSAPVNPCAACVNGLPQSPPCPPSSIKPPCPNNPIPPIPPIPEPPCPIEPPPCKPPPRPPHQCPKPPTPTPPTPGGNGSTGTFTTLTPLTVNTAVFISKNDTATPALAIQADGYDPAVGIVISVQSPTSVTVQYSGEVKTFTGLVAGQTYFLSDTVPGAITDVAPVNVGSIVQVIGEAKDSTTLIVYIGDVIYL